MPFRGGATVVTLLAHHAVIAAVAALPVPQPSYFWRSSELGIAHCSLPATIGEDVLNLHIWIRIATPAATAIACAGSTAVSCATRAHVRGFAFLQDLKTFTNTRIQMTQSSLLADLDLRMYLRSGTSNTTYDLQVDSPVPAPWIKDNVTNKVIDISGALALQPEDVRSVHWELRVQNFEWYCNVGAVGLPGIAAPPAPPPPSIPSSAVAAIQPFHSPPPSSLPRGSSHLYPSRQSRGRAQQGRKLSLTTLPSQDPAAWSHASGLQAAWPYTGQASLTENTQVVVVFTNYYGIDMASYTRALWLSVIWHHRMGVSRFVQFVTERMSELLQQPGIQALIEQGWLEVVLFDDLPMHEAVPLNPGPADVYAFQHLLYNHATLQFWGTDTLLLNIDTDEYMMTPRPTSLVQVFKECSSVSDSTAALKMSRFAGGCKEGLPNRVCDPDTGLVHQWMEYDLEAVAARETDHPLLTLATTSEAMMHGKAMLDPNRARSVITHMASAYAPYTSVSASPSCVYVLHATGLYKPRPWFTHGAELSANGTWYWPGTRGRARSGKAGTTFFGETVHRFVTKMYPGKVRRGRRFKSGPSPSIGDANSIGD